MMRCAHACELVSDDFCSGRCYRGRQLPVFNALQPGWENREGKGGKAFAFPSEANQALVRQGRLGLGEFLPS